MMKKLLFIVAVGFVLYSVLERSPYALQSFAQGTDDGAELLAQAFDNRTSDLQVGGSGTVIKLLADDTIGSQHQKFILRLSSGQTLLVSHNIDLAPRINRLETGDVVEFFGEYEWNSRGGVVHWTHHDPGGHHVDGWLRHEGATYR